VWHRDDDAVHVLRQGHALGPARQVGRGHMGRDADRVAPRVMESLRHAGRGFDLGNRVAHDEVHARGAAQGLGHVSLF